MKPLIWIGSCVAVCLCTSVLAEVPFTQDDVRAQYVASKQLPTGIAYQEFLRLLAAEEDSDAQYELALVSEALGIPLVRNGKADTGAIERVRSRLTLFRESETQMVSDQRRTAFDLMCVGEPFASIDEAFESMNVVDDSNEFSAERRLRQDLRRLGSSERQSLAQYLEQMKSTISYVKVDSRASFKDSMADMSEGERVAHIQHRLATSCANLKAGFATQPSNSMGAR
ncbi:MAG: hypothetical protein AAFX10_08050 [Pseudomonadota bacterium]